MKNVTFQEFDTDDEKLAVVNRVIDNLNLVEGKVLQLVAEKTAKKPSRKTKKKGFINMKTLLMVFVVTMLVLATNAFAYVATDINYDIASNPETLQQYLRDAIASGTFTFTPMAAPAGNDIIEGKMYYDVTARTWYGSKDGSTWTEFETGSSVSLDAAYNVGSAIDVDTSAVTMTTSDGDDNVVLAIVQLEGTNNNDGMTIEQTGTGDALQISPQDTDSGGINIIGKAAGSVPLIILDASTNNMNLADDKGQLLVQNDTAYANAGASAIVVLDSSTPITSAEGFLARFVLSGTARTNAFAVEIEVPATQPALFMNGGLTVTGQASANHNTVAITGNDGSNNKTALTVNNEGTAAAVIITCDDTDTPALSVVGKASSSVTLVAIDGDTGDWIGGADDVAMVEIVGGATANANAGGGLFAVISGTTPAASSEGFLTRFIHTGTATSTAHAVEIECTNAQPALMLNNRLTITGVDSTGVLVAITGNDDTGDTDVMTIANGAASDGIQITNSDVSSTAINCIATASQITPTIIIDGATNNIDLADDKGQILITCDDPYIHAGGTALMVLDSSTPINSAEGFLARFVHSGTKKSGSFAVEIEVPAQQPALAVNSQVVLTGQASSALTTLSVVGNDGTNNTHAFDLHNEGTAAAMLITPDDTDTPALLVTGIANSSVTVVTIDGDTGDWIGGADNVAMVEIIGGATANADAGGGLFAVISGTNPAAASEGFLARFIHTGTATTDAYAVEIETTATTPCLMLNGQMTIAGQGATDGVLLDITSADTDNDTVQLVGVGNADVLQVTPNATTATGIHVVGVASTTASLSKIIGNAGAGWIGAASTGMFHLTNDGTAADTTASMIYMASSGTNISGQEGMCLNMVDTTTSGGGTEYVMHIDSTNNEGIYVDSGIVLIDESLTATLGNQFGLGQTITADDSEGLGQVNDGTSYVTVTAITVNADDFITLPDNPPVGTVLIVSANGVGFEIRTLQSGNDTINTVDTSDGGTEYVMNNLDIATFIYFAVDSWTGTTITTAGVRSGTVTPD